MQTIYFVISGPANIFFFDICHPLSGKIMVHPLAGFRPEGIEELVAKVSTLSQCLFKFPHTINYKLYLMTAKLHFYTWPLRPSNKTNKRIVTKLADYGKSQQLKRCLSFPLALTDCFGEKPEKLSEQYIVSNRRYLRILDCKRHVLDTASCPFGDSSLRYVRTRKIGDTSV